MGEEPISQVTEKFIKLQCFIDSESRHIDDGIKKGFAENVERNSMKLGRNAIWAKTKAISALPEYIPVQLVRFFWKQKTQKNAKILRKIIFPIEKLDVYDFCNQKLKDSIEKYRRYKLEQEDKAREKRQAVKKAEEDKKEKQSKNDNTNEKMEVDAVSKEEEKKEKVEPIDVSQLE